MATRRNWTVLATCGIALMLLSGLADPFAVAAQHATPGASPTAGGTGENIR
ncbi:MAG: hypothetical protein H0T49_00730, partial [Chloroflexia bacterium]|nr:hypothetical protein [Chloroflexia bacterium]